MERAIVFTRTKRGADKLVRTLAKARIAAEAIHGNKSQPQRERVLAAFRDGGTRVLVATDIAARGIDVDGISHVVNYDLPNEPESYVHRIGRTARAGATGAAISLCDHDEVPYLRSIEKLIRMSLPATDRRSAPGRSLEATPERREGSRRPHRGRRSAPQHPHGAASRPQEPRSAAPHPQEPRSHGPRPNSARPAEKGGRPGACKSGTCKSDAWKSGACKFTAVSCTTGARGSERRRLPAPRPGAAPRTAITSAALTEHNA